MRWIVMCLLLLAACEGRMDSGGRSFVDKDANTGPAAIPGQRTPLQPVQRAEEPPPAIPEFLARGAFESAAHDTRGIAEVIRRGESTTLQLRGFKTDPGPDLKVWLATDAAGKQYVSLGDLVEIDEDQSYTIPRDVDLEKYDTVLIWCERFSVLFGSAPLEIFFNSSVIPSK